MARGEGGGSPSRGRHRREPERDLLARPDPDECPERVLGDGEAAFQAGRVKGVRHRRAGSGQAHAEAELPGAALMSRASRRLTIARPLGGAPRGRHEAGARWAVDPQPVRPAAIPSCGAQHDPGDTAMPFVKGEDQPRQFRGWVIGPGPPAAVKQGGTGSVRLQEHPWPATGCRADRRLVSGHSRNLFGNDGHLRQLA
jgi:hypothetical protein